jgi:hypothetical protein
MDYSGAMRKSTTIFAIAVLGLLATAAPAADKGMMHCFAYTVKGDATDADFAAFYKATEEMPKKIKEVKQVWFGKLRRPLAQYRMDATNAKKFTAEAPTATVEATRVVRQQGVCMLLESEAALKVYEAHPYHKDWVAAYEKVRVAGTTTYDILAQ